MSELTSKRLLKGAVPRLIDEWQLALGGDKLIKDGAKSLKSMEAQIDTDKMNALSFLMVLTGTP